MGIVRLPDWSKNRIFLQPTFRHTETVLQNTREDRALNAITTGAAFTHPAFHALEPSSPNAARQP